VALTGPVTRHERPRSERLERFLPLFGLVVLVAAWEFAVRAFDLPSYLLPAPSAVIGRILDNLGTFAGHIAVTAYEALLGLSIAIVIAVVLALLLSRSRRAERLVFPYLVLIQVTPIVAIAPLLIIWLGPGLEPKVAIAVIIAFFPIVVTTVTGLQSADPAALDLMRSYAATEIQEYRYLRIPHAVPYLLAGFRIAAPLAVVGAIVAEMVGSDKGLGFLIIRAKGILDTELLFAGILGSALLGISLFLAFSALERRVRVRS
jgi:NitT/TauT family transport system permease protein